MSHFSLFVFGENIDEQLAPFAEQLDVEFKDCTEEVTDGWNSSTDDKKVKYVNIENYAKEYYEYESREVLGQTRFGHMHNPNAKWDWHKLGGRWSGFFKLKPGRRGTLGVPGDGWYDAPRAKLPDVADQAALHDIDFEGMRREARAGGAVTWNQARAAMAPHPPLISWDSMRAQHEELEIDEFRDLYRAQPALKALSAVDLSENSEQFLLGREEFCARVARRAGVPFAVLKDGKWYERGGMGWWGIVRDPIPDDKWHEKVAALLAELPGDTIVSLVDCHI